MVIQTQFADVSSFSENIAPVKVGNKWGYIHHPFKR
ncbi:WG repeat-containing protein [Nostoc sp. MG11]